MPKGTKEACMTKCKDCKYGQEIAYEDFRECSNRQVQSFCFSAEEADFWPTGEFGCILGERIDENNG